MKRLYAACCAVILAALFIVDFLVLEPLADIGQGIKHVMHSTLKVAVLVSARTLAGPARMPRAGAVPRLAETYRWPSWAHAERRRPLISPRWRVVPST